MGCGVLTTEINSMGEVSVRLLLHSCLTHFPLLFPYHMCYSIVEGPSPPLEFISVDDSVLRVAPPFARLPYDDHA